jgi:hypothetical protein
LRRALVVVSHFNVVVVVGIVHAVHASIVARVASS